MIARLTTKSPSASLSLAWTRLPFSVAGPPAAAA